MEHPVVRVLLVEDDSLDAMLVRRMLAHEASPQRASASTRRPSSRRHSTGNGIETAPRVREVERDLPIVVFTIAGDCETAVQALRAGAQDFLVKGEISDGVLLRAIRYAMERRSMSEEKRRLEEQALRAADMVAQLREYALVDRRRRVRLPACRRFWSGPSRGRAQAALRPLLHHEACRSRPRARRGLRHRTPPRGRDPRG
jgi:DNA-binding NtrC family response regulator